MTVCDTTGKPKCSAGKRRLVSDAIGRSVVFAIVLTDVMVHGSSFGTERGLDNAPICYLPVRMQHRWRIHLDTLSRPQLSSSRYH